MDGAPLPDVLNHWHFEAHTSTKAQLNYVFAQVARNYNRQAFFQALINDFFAPNGIASYGIYEVYGSVDIILKIWIPPHHISSFQQKLEKWARTGNESMRLKNVYPTSYHTCRFHFLWSGAGVKAPDAVALNLVSDLQKSAAEPYKDEQLMKVLQVAGLCKTRNRPKKGFRVIFAIQNEEKQNDDGVEFLAESFVKACTALEGIDNIEIYQGSGKIWLLVDAYVGFKDYSKIADLQLLATKTGIRSMGSRTETFLCVSNTEGVHERDQPYKLDSEAIKAPTVDELINILKSIETDTVEIKSSVRLDLNGFFKGSVSKDIENKIEDRILATISAFLNCSGGMMIFGVAEPDKLAEEARNELNKSYPLVGTYRIFGIQQDVAKGDQDKYGRHVKSIVESRIGAVAAYLIRIFFVEIEHKVVCIAKVPKSGQWHYLRHREGQNEFFVRSGAATKKLESDQQEDYQREHPKS